MGTIVNLPAERRRRRIAVRATQEATILLFMGVRYVRDSEPAPASVPSQTTGRAREDAPLELA